MIHAARVAFAAHGFHGTGIAQIAQESGVLVGQIYRDFANKEAIVAVIVERDLEEFLAERGLAAAHDPQAVRDWIARFVACEGAEQDGGRLVAEIMAEASRNTRIAAIVRQVHERMRCELRAALRLLVPDDVPAERFDRLVGMIETIGSGVFNRRLAETDQPSEDVVVALINCINAAIDRVAA